jgi:hypothetical protein
VDIDWLIKFWFYSYTKFTLLFTHRSGTPKNRH